MPGSILYCLGEVWMELESTAPLASTDSFHPHISGTAAELALCYAAQGGKSALLTQLGGDAFGHRAADALTAAGADTSRVCFASHALTSVVFGGAGELLPFRSSSAELLYTPEQLGTDWAEDASALAFSSACLIDSPCRYTHLTALDTARFAGVPVCFLPTLRPALWPSPEVMRDTVLQFLPLADILILTADEMEQLLDTRDYQIGLFALLRGHTQLIALQTDDGIHLFTRSAHASCPGLTLPAAQLAAQVLCRMQTQDITLAQLPRLNAAALHQLL